MNEATEPIITKLPTVDEFVDLTDAVLDAGLGDERIASLIKLIMTPVNAEDDVQWELANAAARRAYARTEHFERSFFVFTRHPRYAPLCSEKITIASNKLVM